MEEKLILPAAIDYSREGLDGPMILENGFFFLHLTFKTKLKKPSQPAWWLCTHIQHIQSASVPMLSVLPQIGHHGPQVTGLYVLVSLVFLLSAVIGENFNFMGQKLSKLFLSYARNCRDLYNRARAARR